MMTGKALAAYRRHAGLSQSALADRAGVGRHAVSYWETKPVIDRTSYAVERMAEVLGLPSHERRMSKREIEAFAALEAEVEKRLAKEQARIHGISSRRRVICGAKTRKGTPCRCKSEPGKRRCKFHGGKSTGPRTPEGKARIAEGQARRWEHYRAKQGV